MMRYDLHVHSVYSDGSDQPEDIIKTALRIGLDRIALTDHDCIDGLEEAISAAKGTPIAFIPGIELSVRYEGNRLLHILGYGLDITNQDFLEVYRSYRARRQEALTHVVSALNKRDIIIRIEDLRSHTLGETMDRQAVARWLVANEVAENISQAWVDYLDYIPYADGELLSPSEAFKMIHMAGGKAYVAHIHKWIGFLGYDHQDVYDRIGDLVAMGLDGIEAEYPTYSKEDKYLIDRLIIQYGLLKSGGSDYHGSNRPGVLLGQLSEEMSIV